METKPEINLGRDFAFHNSLFYFSFEREKERKSVGGKREEEREMLKSKLGAGMESRSPTGVGKTQLLKPASCLAGSV